MILHTEDYGPGPSRIALIHGISGSQIMFHDLIERLVADGHSVTGVDLRGHGDSERAASYDVEEIAADLVETLPGGLGAVAGHSLGGIVLAIAAESLAPERAIYLDPAWFIPTSFDADAMHANVGEHPDGTPMSLDELAALNPGWGEDNLRRARISHDLWDPKMLDAMAALGSRPRFKIEAPVVPSLVLLADESPLYPGFPQADLIDAGYEVRIQAGAGHNLHLDDPDATVRCLAGWL